MGTYNVNLGGTVGLTGGLGIGLTTPITLNPITINHVQAGLDTITINHIQIGLDPITINPIEIRITRIPDVRAHLPVDMSVGICVLGFDLLSVSLCGEAQLITEPYVRNPCERCGTAAIPGGKGDVIDAGS